MRHAAEAEDEGGRGVIARARRRAPNAGAVFLVKGVFEARRQLVLLVGVDKNMSRDVDDHVVAVVNDPDAACERGAAKFADPEGRQVSSPLSAIVRAAELGEGAGYAGQLGAAVDIRLVVSVAGDSREAVLEIRRTREFQAAHLNRAGQVAVEAFGEEGRIERRVERGAIGGRVRVVAILELDAVVDVAREPGRLP